MLVGAACAGCGRFEAGPVGEPYADSAAERSAATADEPRLVDLWARRDVLARSIDRAPSRASTFVEAAWIHRALARELAAGEDSNRERVAAVERAARARALAPDDLAVRFVLIRLELDRARRSPTLVVALAPSLRASLEAILAADRAHHHGAALGAMGELYARLPSPVANSHTLERAAAYFECALEVSRDYLPTRLAYVELVLLPSGAIGHARRHLVACRDAPLEILPDAQHENRWARAGCAEHLASMDRRGES